MSSTIVEKKKRGRKKQNIVLTVEETPETPSTKPPPKKRGRKPKGGKIIQQNKIFHGYQSVISVLPSSKVFKNIKNLSVGRYHSLKLQEPFHSNPLKITMRCKISKVAMALEDHTNNVFGFQFHPDSYLTKNGKLLIQKILSA